MRFTDLASAHLRLTTNEDFQDWYKDKRTADISNSWEAIAGIDELLKEYGLQLVLYDGTSEYIIEVEKI
tara:strand:- start:34 stop:240 length:207 start_codon:yes stop_codon:yes gene_type:complete